VGFAPRDEASEEVAVQRPKFTSEFRNEAVRLVLDTGRPIAEVAPGHGPSKKGRAAPAVVVGARELGDDVAAGLALDDADLRFLWSRMSGLNRRPTAYKAVALPLS
jgi:hypothetical protein